MTTARAVLGMVPSIDLPATDDQLRYTGHVACHMAFPTANHCHVRVLWPSHRWQITAAFREAGCDDEAKNEDLVSKWAPGLPAIIAVLDIEVPADGPAPSRTYVN